MQELVGQSFHLDDGDYRIVVVRKLKGEIMVYAESEEARNASYPRGPRRAAFHYADLAPFLDRKKLGEPHTA